MAGTLQLPPGLGRPIALADQALVSTALAYRERAPAEYAFANLYLFRERHDYRLVKRPLLHVRGISYDGVVHALPLETGTEETLKALAADGVACLFPIADRLGRMPVPTGWRWDFCEADSDYWFDGNAMAEMKFTKQRRTQGRDFAARQHPLMLDWDASLRRDAAHILRGWAADVGRPPSTTDENECALALEFADQLGLQGGLVLTGDGEPVAFLLASAPRADVRVVHFAKGRRAHSGAYPWMFSAYAKRSRARWINFEQDLGNAGLAQSKRSYCPVEVRAKWRLCAPG